jgi:hypothetical protein
LRPAISSRKVVSAKIGAEGKKLDHGVLEHGVLDHGVLDRSFPYDELDTGAGKAYILNC